MLAGAASQQEGNLIRQFLRGSQGRPSSLGMLALALQSYAITRIVSWLARRMAPCAVMRAFSF